MSLNKGSGGISRVQMTATLDAYLSSTYTDTVRDCSQDEEEA